GVDLLMGTAHFTGPKTVAVHLNNGEERELSAKAIFINAGTRPAVPPIHGLDQVKALDSTTIMELDTLPEHLVIIGGGYVGLEFGQMFCRFGSPVTIVQSGDRLLGREDEDIADGGKKMVSQDGIEVLLNTNTLRVAQSSDGGIHLDVQAPQGASTLRASHLLVA